LGRDATCFDPEYLLADLSLDRLRLWSHKGYLPVLLERATF
jgi:hypothetical protein